MRSIWIVREKRFQRNLTKHVEHAAQRVKLRIAQVMEVIAFRHVERRSIGVGLTTSATKCNGVAQLHTVAERKW